MLLMIEFVVSLLRTVSDTDSGDAWELACLRPKPHPHKGGIGGGPSPRYSFNMSQHLLV
jgi:hypothetical protein